ncbi:MULTISPECIES: hypothetical protein [unclassified Microcoleus]|uniref:hypothetical protein n=1 Tax=unclassified Microcoleus TaxID=2642155 RepID=UPI002FD18A00
MTKQNNGDSSFSAVDFQNEKVLIENLRLAQPPPQNLDITIAQVPYNYPTIRHQPTC